MAFWNPTVWSDKGIESDAWRMRGIVRYVLPLFDLALLWFGLAGVLYGIGSVRQATSLDWQTSWSGLIAASALVALIGVSFPKLWVAELFAKIVLTGLIVSYVLPLVVRHLTEPYALATTGLYLTFIFLPVWRIGDLGYVAWKKGHGRRAKRA